MSWGGGTAGPGGGGYGNGGVLGGMFNRQDMGPRGRFGVWPGCGCSSLLIIIAGIFLVCAGGLRMFGQ